VSFFEIEQQATARPSCGVEETLVQSVDILGVHISDEVGKLVLVTHVLEYDLILFIERYVCAEAPLLEQFLRHEYYADVSVITASGEEITHAPRIGLVQQIVRHYDSRFITRLFEIVDASVVENPSSGTCQLLTRDVRVFAEAPHDIAEIGQCAVYLDR